MGAATPFTKVDDFRSGRAAGKNIIGCHSPEELVQSLEKPRKVMCMIKAGSAVDAFIDSIVPYLEAGDIIIDGGNSHFIDTIRRAAEADCKGLWRGGLCPLPVGAQRRAGCGITNA